MPRLYPINWRKFEKFLFFIGCRFEREEGDHRIYWKDGLSRPIVVPREKQLPIFIIRNNLRVLGVDTQEYIKILGKM
jgi:predicted RNA binding protein YcfA (HicA-like mRNA interferase family)